MTIGQVAGVGVTLLFLADIFLTVLYARAGTGLLAPAWTRAIWTAMRGAAPLFGRHRKRFLSLAGPFIVTSLIGFWALGLTVGAALVIRPELGQAIRPSSGDTPSDFITAMLVAGNSLSIVGSGNYAPHTTGTRLLYLANSLIGGSVLSIVLSYLVQVYSGLRERNALALTIHLMTEGTGDASVMLTRLLPGGDRGNATSELSNVARSLVATKEAHHFYPLLFYFRFEEPYYAVSRLCFVLLDLTTLIDTALDKERLGTLAESAPVVTLREAAILMLNTLGRTHAVDKGGKDDSKDTARYMESYALATATLTRAGIPVQSGGLEKYVAQRREWEPHVRRIAPLLGYELDEIEQRQTARDGPHHRV